MRRVLIALAFAVVGVTAVLNATLGASRSHAAPPKPATGIHKIKHVIVIMQENRSFDHYFGTYPGVDGLPRNADGTFRVCLPNPATARCEKPFHDTRDLNAGGPHSEANATRDIDGGRMDGFVAQAENARVKGCAHDPNNPICSQRSTNPDVLGYHDGRDIPNDWAYARNFVLQDHIFEPNASWSLPAHLFMVSEWSAKCASTNPFSCVNALQSPGSPPDQKANKRHIPPDYAWTDLTYLLHKHHVSWRYYVFKGKEPDCRDDGNILCHAPQQSAKTPGIW